MLEQPRLDALARAATVVLMSADGSKALWGSGFFVAPRTVLTAAHVLAPHLSDPGSTFAVRNELVHNGAPVPARMAHSLRTDREADGMVPLEEDFALVELLDESVEHECVWLCDNASWYGHQVAAYAFRVGRDGAVPFQARLEVNARDGWYGVRFASSLELPPGCSGGPVVDTASGAVVGMLKARRAARDGGLGALTSALRRFGAPYRDLMARHDRWHGRRPLGGSVRNWVDEQQAIATAGRTVTGELWTPHDRRTALGLLADLPAPPDAATVANLARRAAGGWEWAGALPELLCWRDGHGLLYDGATPRDATVFLGYLRLVAEHVRAQGGAVEQLTSWIEDRCQTLDVPDALPGRASTVPGPERVAATARGTSAVPASALPPTTRQGGPVITTATTTVAPAGTGGSPGPADDGEAYAPAPLDCWTAGGAVLVGVGAYDHLPAVPAIHNNLVDLRRLLVSGFGVPPENCRVVRDPRDPKRIHAAVEEVVDAVDPARGAFLFYYAGHGRSHPSHGRLLLSMADSRERQTFSYWNFENLRDQIAECGLARRLVILDSCYSGSALDLLSGLTDSSAAIRGTYVMTSSGATEPSTAPLGARHTDFTGRILSALGSGIPDAGPVIDADALFEHVRADCLASGLPVPARQIRNDGSRIPLIRNSAHGGGART